jgi:hypothetical protein
MASRMNCGKLMLKKDTFVNGSFQKKNVVNKKRFDWLVHLKR